MGTVLLPPCVNPIAVNKYIKFATSDILISLAFVAGFLRLFIPVISHFETLFSCTNRLRAADDATLLLACRCPEG
jgi:hypothetical protein